MSLKTVRAALDKAVTTNASAKKPQVTRTEARSIIAAATADAKVSQAEAEVLARLAGASTFEQGKTKVEVTDAARQEVEAFFAARALPYGKNEKSLRDGIEQTLNTADLSKPLAKAPSTTGLHRLLLSDQRPVDGPLREAYVDPSKKQFFLKTYIIGRGNPGGTTQWFGPFPLKGAALAPVTSGHDADVAALKGKLEASVKGMLFMSESDYPLDYFSLPAATSGSGKPGGADMLQLLKLPAGTKVEVRDFAAFFDRLSEVHTEAEGYDPTQIADEKKYGELRKVMEAGLTDLTVIRTGDIQIGVYIVGRNSDGDLVGLHTTSIET